MPSFLNSTIDTKIQVRLQVDASAVQRRLPGSWRVAPSAEEVHRGTNLMVIFSDVLLRQDADGFPSPDAVNRFVGFLIPAVDPQTGEKAVFMARIFSAHTAAVPGRYRNSVLADVTREQAVAGTGLHAVCSERFALSHSGGGTIELRLRYHRGVPSRMVWPTTMRSAADPSIVRVYRSDALLDVVRSLPAGIDRVEDYVLHVTVPELGDLFDGSERLISITVVPWFVRQEYEPSGPSAS